MRPDYYDKAKRKVAEKKKFNKHLQSYLTTMGIFFAMSFMIGPLRRIWGMVAVFWGIGLFSHYVKAYGFPGMEEEDDWEEKEIAKEIRRMEAKDRWNNSPPNKTESIEDELNIDEHLDLERPMPQPQKKYKDEDLV